MEEEEMPILDRWWIFAENIVGYEQDVPGVYELGDTNGMVVYVGSSNQLRRRLREHLGESMTSCIKKHVKQYRVEYTQTFVARERQLYDEHVRVHGKPPLCNSQRP